MNKIFVAAMLLAAVVPNVSAQSLKAKLAAMRDSVNKQEALAQQGDANAMNKLGSWYYQGKYVDPDYREAVAWWTKAVEHGHVEALSNLALCYQLGKGTPRDSVQAMDLYLRSAMKGNDQVIRNHEQTFQHSGSLFSCRFLAECYDRGIGVEANADRAVTYQRRLAEQGDAHSQYAVGLYHLNRHQPAEAAPWIEKAAAAGDVGAVFYKGRMLYHGQGMAKDAAAGLRLMERAGQQGFPLADYELGRIYYEGDGVPQDLQRGLDYLRKGATGNEEAAWYLAQSYLEGKGVKRDYRLAAHWMACAVPHHESDIRQLLQSPQNEMFRYYVEGMKLMMADHNHDAALYCFTKIGKAGIAEGDVMAAACLSESSYDKRNPKKAAKTLEKLAAEGSPSAAYYLSRLYASGEGVTKNMPKTVSLLEKAAAGDVAEAQCALANRYMTGEGTAQDEREAARYYLRAEAMQQLSSEGARQLMKCYQQRLVSLPDLMMADKRIEQLRHYQYSNPLFSLFRML